VTIKQTKLKEKTTMSIDYHHKGSVFVLLCIVVAMTCQCSETSPSDDRDEQLVLDSFLTLSDVPEGWFLYSSGVEVREGDTLYQREFVPNEVKDQPELDFIFVLQGITVYTSETKARSGYQKWLQPSLKLERHIPTEISFHSRADEFRVGCSYGITDTQPENVCVAIARYDRLVSQVIAKVWDKDDEEQWFTWVDFEQVLEAMDRRALEAAGR